MTFEEIGVDANVLAAIQDLGFETPTPIQEQTIPHLLNNADQDLLACAQTGTGKTAAFGVPIIQQIDIEDRNTQCIILSPTRELCMQIAKDIESYATHIKGLNVLAVYGGSSIDTQIKALNRGAQIVVGTPGRTLDLVTRRRLKLNNVQWLVLDEADEMLNMGFKEELDDILSETPEEKQTLLFSATMPNEVARIARTYMHDTKEIKVGEKNAGAKDVTHEYCVVKASDKYEALKRIADMNPDIYGIVFCRTRQDTKHIAQKLIEDGYNADALHGDLSQAQRDMVMQRFRVGNLQILVATDVAARGLDVNDLTHIINYNFPDDPEVYVHRSGRTGRAGKKGLSISIAHSREMQKIKTLERMVKKPFTRIQVPLGEDIVIKRLYNFIDNILKTDVNEKQIAPFLDDILEKFNDLTREELIKKLVSAEFDRFVSYYKNAKDINAQSNDKGRDAGYGKKNRPKNYARFYINLGTRMDVNAATLMGIINENTRNKDIAIGKIDLMKGFSFFEVDKQYEKEIEDAFANAKYKGQKLVVEVSNSKPVVANDSYGKRRNRGKRYEDNKSSFRKKNKFSDNKFDKRKKRRK